MISFISLSSLSFNNRAVIIKVWFILRTNRKSGDFFGCSYLTSLYAKFFCSTPNNRLIHQCLLTLWVNVVSPALCVVSSIMRCPQEVGRYRGQVWTSRRKTEALSERVNSAICSSLQLWGMFWHVFLINLLLVIVCSLICILGYKDDFELTSSLTQTIIYVCYQYLRLWVH